MPELRPFQLEDFNQVLEAHQTFQRVIGRAATGLGKAVICAALAERYATKGRVLILVDVGKLVRQLATTVEWFTDIKPGIETKCSVEIVEIKGKSRRSNPSEARSKMLNAVIGILDDLRQKDHIPTSSRHIHYRLLALKVKTSSYSTGYIYGTRPGSAALLSKLSSSRARGFIEKYGNECWELDSMPVELLIDEVNKHVKTFLDIDALNRAFQEEKDADVELARMNSAVKAFVKDRLKNRLNSDGEAA